MDSGCEELARLADQHLKSVQEEDSLYVFLRIHRCICLGVEEMRASTELRFLNRRFVHKCKTIYENVTGGHFSPREISNRWVVAIKYYRRRPNSYTVVLPRMAFAHILDDLPECLYDSGISKADFDAVIDTIIGCLGSTLSAISGHNAAKLILNNSFSHWVVHKLREDAWRQVEDRRALANALKPRIPDEE